MLVLALKKLSALCRTRKTKCYPSNQRLQVISLDKKLDNYPVYGQSRGVTTQRIMIWKPNYNLKQACPENGLKVKIRTKEDKLPLYVSMPRCSKRENENHQSPNRQSQKIALLHRLRELECLSIGMCVNSPELRQYPSSSSGFPNRQCKVRAQA